MTPGIEKGRPDDGLSRSIHSQNSNPGDSVPKSDYEGERFGRISLRLHDALEMGDISLDEFAILCWLEGRANYNESPPRVIRTLAGIMEALDWEKSDEALRNKLNKLSGLGLIEYEIRANGKRPYVIYLTGCKVILDATWRELGGSLVDFSKPEGASLPSSRDESSEISPSSHQVDEAPTIALEHESTKAQNTTHSHLPDEHTEEVANGFVNNLGSLEGTSGEGAAEVPGDLTTLDETIAAARSRQPGVER